MLYIQPGLHGTIKRSVYADQTTEHAPAHACTHAHTQAQRADEHARTIRACTRERGSWHVNACTIRARVVHSPLSCTHEHGEHVRQPHTHGHTAHRACTRSVYACIQYSVYGYRCSVQARREGEIRDPTYALSTEPPTMEGPP